MKKIFSALLGLISMGFLISNVNAATLSVGDGSSYSVSKGSSVRVPVKLKDSDTSNYVRIEFQLSVSDSNVKIDYSAKASSGISFGTFKDESGNTTYVLGTQDMNSQNKSHLSHVDNTLVGEVNCITSDSLNSDFKITPTNVKYYKEDGTIVNVDSSNVKVVEATVKYQRPKSNDASLTGLTVSQGELTPAFSSDVTDYKVQVKDTINQIRLSATTAIGATKTGTGSKTLVRGENLFEIEVTAEDGATKKVYTINVICGEVAEPSPYLKDLIINNVGVELSPEFDSKNNKYTVTVGKNIKKLDIKYELEDSLANVTIDGNEDFEDGENVVTITVVSSDEMQEQVYEITVTKETEEEPTTVVDDKKKEDKKDHTWIWILIVAIGALILGGVAFLLFRKKDKSKKSKSKEKLPKVKEDDSDDTEEIVITKEKNDEEIERTQKFDEEDLKVIREKYRYESDDEDDDGKTKEFNFKDLK